MCACARDEASCDPALANNLAQQLYKAGQLSDLRLRIFFSRLFLEVRKSLVFLCSMEVFDYIRTVEKQNKIKQITSSFTERWEISQETYSIYIFFWHCIKIRDNFVIHDGCIWYLLIVGKQFIMNLNGLVAEYFGYEDVMVSVKRELSEIFIKYDCFKIIRMNRKH